MAVDITTHPHENVADPDEVEQLGRLVLKLEAAVTSAVHEVNNPLAIISGNAQFLTELGRAMDLDDELAKPIADIEEASRLLAARLRILCDLKEEVIAAAAEMGCRD